MDTKHGVSRRDVLRASLYGGLGMAAYGLMGASSALAGQEEAPKHQGQPLEFALMGGLFNIGWWIDPRMGWTAAGKELNIKFTEFGPVEFAGDKQATIMEEVIASKPDAIILTPLDPDVLVDPCRKAMEAGIPVMIFNSDIRKPQYRLGLIGMQNYNGGYLQGKYVVDNLLKGKPAKALFMTVLGVENHESRKAGVMQAFKEAGNVEVADIVDERADYTRGPQMATAALLAKPDINLIVATDATGGESACRALVEMGKADGSVIVMGMDRDDSMIKYIKDGVMAATAVQRNFLELYLATTYMYKHVKGDWIKGAFPSAPAEALAKLPAQIPPLTDTGVMFCTPENVDFFFHEKPKAA
jgi:ribose transport system substrate-binding protein